MKTDVLVIGGGIAGVFCAEAASEHCDVTVVTDGSFVLPELHGIELPSEKYKNTEDYYEDTLKTGCYLNRKNIAEVLCSKGFALSGNDLNAKKFSCNFNRLNNVRAMRLQTKNGRVTGAYCFDKVNKKWFFISASSVVLATGGFEKIFSDFENSCASDAMAMAYDAGAALMDMEFICFDGAQPSTLGGIEINEKCETKVSGLFACGAVAGGAHGACALPGNMPLEAIVFGKIAGKSAADYSLSVEKTKGILFDEDDVPPPFDTAEYSKKVRAAAKAGLLCPRNKENMEQALKIIKEAVDYTEPFQTGFDAVRIYNDATTLSAALWLAYSRLSSIGTHVRSDDMFEEKQLYHRFCHKRFGRLYTEKGSFFTRRNFTL